jgi:hypothetical protein
MARKTVSASGNRVSIGGENGKTGEANPTSFEGFYLNTYTEPNALNPDRPTQIHVFKTVRGEVEIYGKGTMNGSLKKIPKGTFVWINYLGKKPVENKPGVKQHTYQVDNDDEIVDFVSAGAKSAVNDADDDLDVALAPTAQSASEKRRVDALLNQKRK